MVDIVLCRPTNDSVTASILSDGDRDIYLEYGTSSGTYANQTDVENALNGVPYKVVIGSLTTDTQYYYRVRYDGFTGEENKFHTQRATGESFTFTIVADPHFGDSNNYDEKLYDITAENVRADNPDFNIDLGDDFMVNLLPNNASQSDVENEYSSHFSDVALVSKTAPLFMVIGNREKERGWVLDDTADNHAVYAANARKKYYPQPTDGSFYSGNVTDEPFVGLREDYYSWSWGDARFIVLFPWWTTTVNPKQTTNWDWKMGDDQYLWFKDIVENSTETYKFVFIHHVLGGVRGGRKWATQYEWGDDSGLAANRPNWTDSIHKLMIDNGVNAVFQGHDHIYVKQLKNGIVYQTCPFPADSQYRLLNSGSFNGGTHHPNSGHLRVSVTSDEVSVEYIRAYLPGDGTNGEITHSYTI